MLTDKLKSFCKTCIIKAKLSDRHKMIVTFLRASLKEYIQNKIVYRDFNLNELFHKLNLEMNTGQFYNTDKPYDDFPSSFQSNY